MAFLHHATVCFVALSRSPLFLLETPVVEKDGVPCNRLKDIIGVCLLLCLIDLQGGLNYHCRF